MLTLNVTPGNNALQTAIDSLPDDGTPALIRLAPGEYREKVELRRPHTAIEGAGADKTRIVWDDYAKKPHPDSHPYGTFRSYTMLVLAQNCRLEGVTVENAAAYREDNGQVIALFVDGNGFLCEKCTLLSSQDTLFTAPLPPREVIPGGFTGPTQRLPRTPQRQVYRRCIIKGDVDFIFGGAAAWFEDCDIISICRDGRTGGFATAASTPEGQKYGYVFHHCRFLGEGLPGGSAYLGRPWREFAKTILLHCRIGPHIRPEGWDDWGKEGFARTGDYAEYACTGEGSDMSGRAAFSRQLSDEEAERITFADFMEGKV